MVPGQAPTDVRYRVDEFIQDAISLKVTPFMLDNYAHEYEDLVRARDAHKIEMDTLRSTNTRLSTQVYVPTRSCRLGLWSGVAYLRCGACRKTLESDLAQLNTEHCQVLVSLLRGW